jgi:hypothetical protein
MASAMQRMVETTNKPSDIVEIWAGIEEATILPEGRIVSCPSKGHRFV